MKKLSPFQAAKQLNTLMLRSEYTFFSEGRFWTIRQIPLQKRVNLARAGVDCFTRRIHPWAAPTGLMIEPADVCNLNCIGCWTNDDERRGRVRFLALDGFRRIMDDLGDRLFVIWLWGWGEPFLNRNIYDMIRLAREKDIVVISSTNANLNWDRHEAEALVKSGLSQLIVALDGLDQPTYAKYRVGGHLDKVFANLALVQEARRRLNLDTPLINLRMVVMRHNQDQTDEFLALGRSLGVDIVSFKTMCDYRKDGQNTEFPTIRKFQRYAMDPETGRFLDTGQKIYCDRPWKRAHVFADGDITPCEFDMQREFRLGHLTQENDLGECWTNDVARRFRRMFLNDIQQISFCRFCPYKDQVVWDPTVEYHHLSEAAAGR